MKKYYVYVWVTDAPYYVGKGCGNRAYREADIIRRPNTVVQIFRDKLKERHALRIEDVLVRKWGRKGIDAGGILENKRLPSMDWPHNDIIGESSRKKMSESRMGKEPWNKGKTGVYSEEQLNRISEGTKRGMTEEVCKKVSERTSEAMKRPEVKEKVERGIKKSWTPERRKRQSVAQMKRFSNPEERKKTSEGIKRYNKNKSENS